MPLGGITRRFGNAIRVEGNTIVLREPGYYEISVSDTVQPSAAAAISLTVYENGTPLAGAATTATPETASDNTPLHISAAVVRVYCHTTKTITTVLSAAGTVARAAVTVVKV